eukprot:688280-Amphidinium_carterae.1
MTGMRHNHGGNANAPGLRAPGLDSRCVVVLVHLPHFPNFKFVFLVLGSGLGAMARKIVYRKFGHPSRRGVAHSLRTSLGFQKHKEKRTPHQVPSAHEGHCRSPLRSGESRRSEGLGIREDGSSALVVRTCWQPLPNQLDAKTSELVLAQSSALRVA